MISPLARAYYWWVKRRERQIGYRLMLHAPASHWIPATMIFDMTPVWKRFGLNAKGVNYLTVGAVKNGLSARYDAASRYYQAWLGGYIVRFTNPKAWTLENHFALGVADQKNWLELYGVRTPFVEVQKGSVRNRGPITVSGYKGTLYEGNIWSNTDVGDARPWSLSPMMAGMAKIFEIDNPKLKLSRSNFIPQWTNTQPLASFQNILLKGYIAIIPLTPNTTALLYINSCKLSYNKSKQVDYFDLNRTTLEAHLKNISIRAL